MPISTRIPIRRLAQQEFGEIAFEVMRHVFDIHNEIGCYFEEKIYKRELACRLPGVRLEEPIEVTFGTFHKPYFLDSLVADGALFEFKAVETLVGRHRAQLLNYLLLCDLAHGKLINVRADKIEHEFINTQWRFAERLKFGIDSECWEASIPGAVALRDFLVAFLRDLGAGLEIGLYEDAVIHFLGGKELVEQDVAVEVGGHRVGVQRMRLMAPGVAFKITGFDQALGDFESHAHRLLAHADLRAIAWININMKCVTFTVLSK
jgi:GxxExxY protein